MNSPITQPKDVLSHDQVLANMEDRKHAAIDVERLIPEHPRLRYWECLKELAEARIALLSPKSEGKAAEAEVVPEGGMSYQEAIEFQNRARFTKSQKYPSRLVGETPCWYINNWVEGDEFNKQLRRYQKSRVFQDRQDAEQKEREYDG